MERLSEFLNDSNEAKVIIYFDDGRWAQKNETIIYEITKKVFIACMIVAVLFELLFDDSWLFGDGAGSRWIMILTILVYMKKSGGRERRRCPSQLLFYEDYFVFYVPKYHIIRDKEQMEIQKMYYRDVKTCSFNSYLRTMEIRGMLDEVCFRYDKHGGVKTTPKYHVNCEGLIKFYTIFDDEHDFKAIFERNTPINVECVN